MVIAQIQRHNLSHSDPIVSSKVLQGTIAQGILSHSTGSIVADRDLHRLTRLKDIIGARVQSGNIPSLSGLVDDGLDRDVESFVGDLLNGVSRHDRIYVGTTIDTSVGGPGIVGAEAAQVIWEGRLSRNAKHLASIDEVGISENIQPGEITGSYAVFGGNC